MASSTTKSRTAVFALALALAVITGLYLRHELAVDSCLDRGGRWDKGTNECQDGVLQPPS